jgi:hypothetical protein
VSEAFDLREACRQYTGSPVVATSHLEHGQANVSHRVDLAVGDSIVVRILKLTTPERDGDIWASNVFAENGRITAVFDLETTEKTSRVMDIGRTAIDPALEMKTTSVPDILEILRNGYEEVDALTDKERDALPDAFRLAAVACSAWNYNNGFQDYALDAMQHAESL